MVKSTKKNVKSGKKKAQKVLKYVIDCSAPVQDNILEMTAFLDFLKNRIKVGGKTNNLGDTVKVELDKAVNGRKVYVTAKPPFSKRYLKYLTKKYLKKEQMKDWLHVVGSSKTAYELRYFNIHEDADE